MKTLIRFVISTIAVAAVVVLLNGIGWAAVLFWKSEAIAWACTIPTLILCPIAAISVVPQSTLDTPLFFVPMLILCCMFWGAIITLIWNRMKRESQNQKLEGISGNARVS